MSLRSMWVSLAVLVAVSALLIAIGLQRLQRADRQLEAAHSALKQTQRDADTITDLRARSQTIETRQRPAQDVIALINAVLAEVGIPSTHLQSLTPESEGAAVGGPASNMSQARLLQQSLRLTLQNLAPHQIGSFLTQWHASQQVWNAARLELVHNRTHQDTPDPKSGKSAEGNRYDVTVLLTALYLADGSASNQAQERP